MKKAISTFLGLVLLLVMVQPVSALGDINLIDQQTNDEYGSDSYQLMIQEYIQGLKSPLFRTKSLQGSYYVKLDVVDLVQENSYYCGPASIQMVLKYLQVIKSQAEIAQKAGTTDKDGTLVYKVRDTLNYYLDGDPYMYVRIDQVNFTNSYINTLQLKKPAIFLVRTGVLPTYEGMDYGHYVVGTGYLVQWSLTGQVAKVYYNDSYNNPNYPNIYGPNVVNAVPMEQAIRNSTRYIIVGR